MALKKAFLQELDAAGEATGSPIPVQFNPETLKVTYSNQVVPPQNGSAAGAGDQRGNAAIQFVGRGTTKLALQLWFDVTGELPTGQQSVGDVQELVEKIGHFMTPRASRDDPSRLVTPAARFEWGTFRFDGVMDSMDQSLEFFSEEGVPLRASVSISLSKQDIVNTRRQLDGTGSGGGQGGAGRRPMTAARSGDTLQNLAAALGKASTWSAIAAANNIENPRLLAPGQLIDMNALPRVGR